MATKCGIFAFIVLIVVQGTSAFSLPYLFGSSDGLFSRSDEGGKSSRNFFNEAWSFSIGLTQGKPLEYADEDGNIRGFYKDLIDEICKEAGQECEVIYDDYNNCYLNEEGGQATAGQGLLGRWYEGCMGYIRIPKRAPVLDFSVPLLNYDNPSGRFYVLRNNPGVFDPLDVSGKRIGFISGWMTDENCVARDDRVKNFGTLKRESKVYLQQEFKLAVLLRNKEVDAIFLPVKGVLEGVDDIEAVGPEIQCGVGDITAHVITRKGSSVLSWFDQAFERIKENGRYDRICHLAESEHGGSAQCLV